MTPSSSRSSSMGAQATGLVAALLGPPLVLGAAYYGHFAIGAAVAVLSIVAGLWSLFAVLRKTRQTTDHDAGVAVLTADIIAVSEEIGRSNLDVRLPPSEGPPQLAAVRQAVNAMLDHVSAKLAETSTENDRIIARIASVCSEISKGNFEARITNIVGTGPTADAQHAVNDMIDRCDAFVREATAALDAVCRNIYYRRILYAGLNGTLRLAAEKINTAIEMQAKVEQAKAEGAAEQVQLIETIGQGLSNLSNGNLVFRLTGLPESYRKIEEDFNQSLVRLQAIIADIKAASAEVANAAAEISTSTTDLSQRTEEQAAGLEETSATMEEIAATVKKNAENAQQANTLTVSTCEVADKGGQVVANAVGAMSRIEESSRKISDIIGVIDEIARQTNLLALNAAVEAARAGDAGRGFAVVASEVRSLAQRSSQAAKDIKDLITSSNSQVQEGVELVNQAGTSLNEIVESIKSVAQIVGDIANASSEQATGIDQVNKALTQMDEVTQQNSALVEENAATAKTLETQSATMTQQVAFFRLEDGNGVVRAVAKPAAKPAASPVETARAPVAKPAVRRTGAVGRMQAAVATAFKQDADWEEF